MASSEIKKLNDDDLHFWNVMCGQLWKDVATADLELVSGLLQETDKDIQSALKRDFDEYGSSTTVPQSYSIGRPTCPPPAACDSKHHRSHLEKLIASRGSMDDTLQDVINSLIGDRRPIEAQLYERRQKKRHQSDADEDNENFIGMVDGEDLYSLQEVSEPPIYRDTNGDRIPSYFKRDKAKHDHPRHVMPNKRGRIYDEVWKEEDFYTKYENSSLFKHHKVIGDWSELFLLYNDDFDAPYIEWLSNERKARSGGGASSTAPAISTAEIPRKVPNLFKLAPPVPVSCHHPACWGPGSRRPFLEYSHETSGDHRMINVGSIHPACVSKSIVSPRMTNDQNLLDEIEIVASISAARLVSLSESTMEILFHIVKEMHHSYALQSLQQCKLKLQKALDCIASEVLIPASDRSAPIQTEANSAFQDVNYMNLVPLPFTDHTSGGSLRRSSNKRARRNSATNGADEAPTIATSIAENVIPSNNYHTCYKFAGSLQVGDVIEFSKTLQLDQKTEEVVWKLAHVVRLIKDGDLVRFIKIRPLGGKSADNILLAIEDNRICALGTHVPQQIAQWMTQM